MKNNVKVFKIAIITLTVLLVVASIILPKLLLEQKVKHSLAQVVQAPDDYYLTARTATARNASSKLSCLDRMRLIYSTWDSTMSPCDTSEGFLTETEAISTAKSQLHLYYKAGLYPVNLFSDYNNWYSFNCKLYRYIDTTFETYSAYLWEISFYKYDSTEYHTILMSESGTILVAETNSGTLHTKSQSWMRANLTENLFSLSTNEKNISLGDVTTVVSSMPRGYSQIDLTDAEILSMYNVQLKTFGSEFEDFTLFQYKKNGLIYGISIVPAD